MRVTPRASTESAETPAAVGVDGATPRSAGGPPPSAGDPQPADEKGTRERILDIALDLFLEQGFDKTSLREIAERLGTSKAAIYYHFASKDDILMALHLRLHEVGRQAFSAFDSLPPGPDSWSLQLDQVMGAMLANRKLVAMHDRNRAAFEQLHRRDHDEQHDDLQERFRSIMSDASLPLRDRVRIAVALGGMLFGLVLSGDVFTDVPSDQLAQMLREATRDLLRGRPPSADGVGLRPARGGRPRPAHRGS